MDKNMLDILGVFAQGIVFSQQACASLYKRSRVTNGCMIAGAVIGGVLIYTLADEVQRLKNRVKELEKDEDQN